MPGILLSSLKTSKYSVSSALRAGQALGAKHFFPLHKPFFNCFSHEGYLKFAVKLAEFIKKEHLHPEQVQDYYPTPGTISTAMFYTELDPYTLEPVYVAKNPHDKAMQRALMQYFNPKNYDLVEEALKRAGRQDLIGLGSNCLIKPRPGTKQTKAKQSYGKNGNNRYGKKKKNK
jgi:hypothetical protein